MKLIKIILILFILVFINCTSFAQENKTILIFSADWCGACKNLKKDLDNIDTSGFNVEIINVDKNKELKKDFKIKSLPTSVILIGKEEISRKIGYNKKEYEKWIENNRNYYASSNNISIRVLILKHSKEKMADDDAKMVVDAINVSANDSLDIKEIGNHFINETKKIRVAICEYEEIKNLKEFISEKLKINKNENDTVIIFTVGHGSPSGSLQNLGQRSELQGAIAEAAEENNQKVLWWQLSCYAAAKLPPIESLTGEQQELLSVLNTSDEKTPSPAYVEGKIMEKLFSAMIETNEELDVDQNYEITGLELKNYLNKIKKGRGDLLRIKNLNYSVFGINLANKIKIINHTGPAEIFKNFVPMPKTTPFSGATKINCSAEENKILLDLHNKERVSKGIKPLLLNQDLCDYAQKHAEIMMKKNNLYHSKMSELKKVLNSSAVGENIACGQETEESVISCWMKSPGHKRNILNSSYNKVGFGFKKENNKIYWCVVFSN